MKNSSSTSQTVGCGFLGLPLLAALCAASVILGSFVHGTTRIYNDGVVGSGTIAEEGAGRWAVWTLISGGVSLGALVLSTWAALGRQRQMSALLAVLAVLPFIVSAVVAGRHWIRLLEEREREREYVLLIAKGLPTVTMGAVFGAALSLFLAFALFLAARR